MQAFVDTMNKSGWFGSIIEMGMGVPFQYRFMNYSGVSATIHRTLSPYSKKAQDLNGLRSVSKAGLMTLCRKELIEMIDKEDSPCPFVLGISASHQAPGSRGTSHLWICLLTPLDVSFMHITLDKNVFKQRQDAGNLYADLLPAFILKCLELSPDKEWSEIIEEYKAMGMGQCFRIDVIDTPSFKGTDPLLLVMDKNPVVFEEGRLIRVEDALRKSNRIYRGAFNPPTRTHLALGGDALFEISTGSPWKGDIEPKDMTHRINMLALSGKTVMVGGRLSYFAEFHDMMQWVAPGNYEYIIGGDTFNAVTNDKYVPTAEFLDDFAEGGTGKFLVFCRDGVTINKTEHEAKVVYDYHDTGEYDQTISSTRVRNGELNLCTEDVAVYIGLRSLYADTRF